MQDLDSIAEHHQGFDEATSFAPPRLGNLAGGKLYRFACCACGELHFGGSRLKLVKFLELPGLDRLIPDDDMFESHSHCLTELREDTRHANADLDGMLLWRQGLLVADEGVSPSDSYYRAVTADETPSVVALCSSCRKDLQADIRPLFAMSNHQWFGPVAPCLLALNRVEQLLVSLVRHKIYVRTLRPFVWGSGHRAVQGSFGSLPQCTPMLHSILPLSGANLVDELKVIFIGSEMPLRHELKKSYGVSGKRVTAALDYLCVHHPMYKIETDLRTLLWPTAFRSGRLQRLSRGMWRVRYRICFGAPSHNARHF